MTPLDLTNRDLANDALPEWATAESTWSRPRFFRREWEWRSGERTLGSIRDRGFLSLKSLARGPSGEWNVAMKWSGHAEIRDANGRLAASHRPGWWCKGEITNASGQRLVWRPRGAWHPRWCIETESETPIVTFSPVGWRAARYRVAIGDYARRVGELEAIVLLGWRVLLAAEHARHSVHSH